MLKRFIVPMILASCHCFAATQENAPASKAQQNLNIDTLSEAFGNFLGRTISDPENGIHLNPEKMIEGIRNGVAGKPSPMTEQEYQKGMAQLRDEALEAKASENLQNADAFLKENEKKTGVVALIPGKLQYQILQKGNGPAVTETSTPKINYTGKFIDGSVFGSSEQTGPIAIPLSQTIPGFRQGIVGMLKGEKRRLFIHPDVGYGKAGELPPNALLIFDIEVVEADSPKAEKKNPNDEDENDEDLFEIEQ